MFSTWNSPTPATRQPLTLVSAPCDACRILPPCLFAPLYVVGLRPGPCRPLEVPPVVGPYISFVYHTLPHYAILIILSSSGAWYPIWWLFTLKEKGPGRLHYLAVACTRSLPSPAPWPCWRCSGYNYLLWKYYL